MSDQSWYLFRLDNPARGMAYFGVLATRIHVVMGLVLGLFFAAFGLTGAGLAMRPALEARLYWPSADGGDSSWESAAAKRQLVVPAEAIEIVRLASKERSSPNMATKQVPCREPPVAINFPCPLTETKGKHGRGLSRFSPKRDPRHERPLFVLEMLYKLQEEGLDTVEANLALGFRDDERDYAVAAHMLTSLKIESIQLMTNNPKKIDQLTQYGINVTQRIPHIMEANEHNRFYLETKAAKSGHMIDFHGKEHLPEQSDLPFIEGMSEAQVGALHE